MDDVVAGVITIHATLKNLMKNRTEISLFSKRWS